MKRDMELVRKILLAVEKWPPDGGDSNFPELGSPPDEVSYNATQAVKDGLLEGEYFEAGGLVCMVRGLTPAGHDFLDNARNQYVWDEVMENIQKHGLGPVKQ